MPARLRACLLLIPLLALLPLGSQVAAEGLGGVPPERLARLARGVNASHWFSQVYNVEIDGQKGGFRADHFRGWITERDAQAMAALGLGHVRVPVDPDFLMDLETGALRSELLGELDAAIAMLRAQGLAVVVDLHPKQPRFKQIGKEAPQQDALVAWWGAFAAHLAATTDPDWVYLELLNEPGGQKFYGEHWTSFQQRLISAVRAAAPEHTIVVNPGGWMLVRELEAMTPHPEQNLVYSIHYYGPSQFTHQGALWMKDWYRPLRQVPWPLAESDLNAVASALDPQFKQHHAAALKAVGAAIRNGDTSEQALRDELARAAAWARQHGVPLWVGEFGVFRQHASDQDTARWLRVVREVCAEHAMGWSLWDWSGGFALVDEVDGTRQPNPLLVEALGLSLPAAAAQP